VRRQGKGDAGAQFIDEFINMIVEEIKTRKSE